VVFDSRPAWSGAHIRGGAGGPNYTYTEARWSEALPEWIGAHVNAPPSSGRARRGGLRQLKAGVTATARARHQPHLPDLATHRHGILPTRPRAARQGQGRGRAHHRALRAGAPRNRRFFSLFELNAAIREILADLNARIMQARRQPAELLETVERPALKGLPSEAYQYAEWKKCRIAPDYHVEVERHYYSVPSRLIREQVEARITDSTIEIFHKGDRVASHARNNVRNRHTTVREHMPSSHRRYAEWTPARMMREARKIGPATIALVQAVMKAKPHPEQGFRACPASCGGARPWHGPSSACRRGNDIGATTYGSIAWILKNGSTKPMHENRRRRPRRSGTATSVAPATTTEAPLPGMEKSGGPRKERKAMLKHPTEERLAALGLTGMAKALEEQRKQPDIAALSFEERLALMVDRKRPSATTSGSWPLALRQPRQNAVIEDVDMKTPRGLDRRCSSWHRRRMDRSGIRTC
jgi:transposase